VRVRWRRGAMNYIPLSALRGGGKKKNKRVSRRQCPHLLCGRGKKGEEKITFGARSGCGTPPLVPGERKGGGGKKNAGGGECLSILLARTRRKKKGKGEKKAGLSGTPCFWWRERAGEGGLERHVRILSYTWRREKKRGKGSRFLRDFLLSTSITKDRGEEKNNSCGASHFFLFPSLLREEGGGRGVDRRILLHVNYFSKTAGKGGNLSSAGITFVASGKGWKKEFMVSKARPQ